VTSRVRNAHTDYWPCRQSGSRPACPHRMDYTLKPTDYGVVRWRDCADMGWRFTLDSPAECRKWADFQLANFAHRQAAVPVVAPVGAGRDGLAYNINADLAATGIATYLKAEKFILLTNTVGLLDTDGALISETTWSQVEKLVKQGVIHGGMLPKVTCAFDSVKNGVRSAHIIDGRVEHALLLELLTDEGVGTMIR